MGTGGTVAVVVQQGRRAPAAVRLAAPSASSEGPAPLDLVARLRQQLRERDEIIVAMQHVIRELNHEIENRRVEGAYLALARSSGRDRQAAST